MVTYNKKQLLSRDKVDAYLNGQLIVRKGFDPIDVSKGINWNYRHKKNANTYQTYLHSLGIVRDLLVIGKLESNEKLISEARDIITDWYNADHNVKGNYAWAEHPVSSRIGVINEFQQEDHKYKLSDKILDKLIISHCEFLFDERNYKMNNHGLMMDNALLDACIYLKDNKRKKLYLDKVLYRIRYAVYRDFTRKGTHLENSPEYHRLILALFRKIKVSLAANKIKLDEDISILIDRAIDYKRYIIKPDNYYPMIGDTGGISDLRLKKTYKSFIDYDAGIAIMQNRNNENLVKSGHLTFKSGYQSKTHKHLDDLSITLYADGHDIIVDSGKYSYDRKDPIRQYVVSPQGHSGLFLKDKKYKLTHPLLDQDNMRIVKFTANKNYKHVVGINDLYSISKLKRFVVLTKENILIIVDRAVSKNIENVRQNFCINEEAVINQIDALKYEINLNEETYILETIVRGRESITSDISKGYRSHKFSKYVENENISFDQESDNATFLTIFYNKKYAKDFTDVRMFRSRLSYKLFDNDFNVLL